MLIYDDSALWDQSEVPRRVFFWLASYFDPWSPGFPGATLIFESMVFGITPILGVVLWPLMLLFSGQPFISYQFQFQRHWVGMTGVQCFRRGNSNPPEDRELPVVSAGLSSLDAESLSPPPPS